MRWQIQAHAESDTHRQVLLSHLCRRQIDHLTRLSNSAKTVRGFGSLSNFVLTGWNLKRSDELLGPDAEINICRCRRPVENHTVPEVT